MCSIYRDPLRPLLAYLPCVNLLLASCMRSYTSYSWKPLHVLERDRTGFHVEHWCWDMSPCPGKIQFSMSEVQHHTACKVLLLETIMINHLSKIISPFNSFLSAKRSCKRLLNQNFDKSLSQQDALHRQSVISTCLWLNYITIGISLGNHCSKLS